jgi:hypothetical protein
VRLGQIRRNQLGDFLVVFVQAAQAGDGRAP